MRAERSIMDQDQSNAGVGLLMLDLASAKSSLAQLQQACAVVQDNFLRTRCELQDLRQQKQEAACPPYTLAGLPGSINSQEAAQQLRALHTENLQLKACLKQEVEARQALEEQHLALLELLRNGKVLELIAAGHVPLTTAGSPAACYKPQAWRRGIGCAAHSTAADSSGQADQAAPSSFAAANPAMAASDATSSMLGFQQQPGRTTSTSSYSSSLADADSAPQQAAAGTCIGNGSWGQSSTGHMSGVPDAAAPRQPCPPSAYFPHLHKAPTQQQAQQQQQCNSSQQQSMRTSVGNHSSMLHSSSSGMSPVPGMIRSSSTTAARAAVQDSADGGAAAASGTWQDALQHGLFMKLARPAGDLSASSTTQPHSIPPSKAFSAHKASTAAAAMQGSHIALDGDDDVDATFSVSTSSSHTQPSELLDSDDLEELAGLCDDLLQGHAMQQQQQAHMPPECMVPLHPAQQHQQQDSYRHLHPQQQQATAQACVPGLQALAAQLRQLQEQVAATAMDAMPAHGVDATATAAESEQPIANSSLGNKAAYDQERCSPTHDASNRPYNSSSCAGDRGYQYSTDVNGSSSQQQRQAGSLHTSTSGSEGSGMATLQQQLAQRMQEVKMRLSNICTGILQDPPAAAAAEAGPTAGAGAGAGAACGQGHADLNAKQHSSFFSPPPTPPEAAAAEHISNAAPGNAADAGHAAVSSTTSAGNGDSVRSAAPAAAHSTPGHAGAFRRSAQGPGALHSSNKQPWPQERQQQQGGIRASAVRSKPGGVAADSAKEAATGVSSSSSSSLPADSSIKAARSGSMAGAGASAAAAARLGLKRAHAADAPGSADNVRSSLTMQSTVSGLRPAAAATAAAAAPATAPAASSNRPRVCAERGAATGMKVPAAAKPAAAAPGSRAGRRLYAAAGGSSDSVAASSSAAAAASLGAGWRERIQHEAEEDSDSSWATVDDTDNDLEQHPQGREQPQPLQQQPSLNPAAQALNDHTCKRTTATTTTAAAAAGSPIHHVSSSTRIPDSTYMRRSTSGSLSSCKSGGSATPHANSPSGLFPERDAGATAQQQDNQQPPRWQEQQSAEAGLQEQRTPQQQQQNYQSLERPASPVSCESSMGAVGLKGQGRMAAEVVFSPLKQHPFAGCGGRSPLTPAAAGASPAVTPLRPRNL